MLKALHVALAYLTVAGFLMRSLWALTDSPLRRQRWVRVAPHVIDTLLLTAGVLLAIRLGVSPLSGWLAAKLLGLLAYIGFGVLTLRASRRPMQLIGLGGALLAVSYVFAVAFSRSPWPL